MTEMLIPKLPKETRDYGKSFHSNGLKTMMYTHFGEKKTTLSLFNDLAVYKNDFLIISLLGQIWKT